MEEYKLTTSDYVDINNLIKLTQRIDLLYQKLYGLEINNKKNTTEYTKTVNAIITLREEEDKYYDLDFNKCIVFIGFISTVLSEKNINTNTTDNIINQDYIKKYLIRILTAYNNKIISDKNIANFIPEELRELIEDKELQKMLKDGTMIKDSITNDKYNTFMYFLEEEINNKENKYLKNKLVELKYYASFIDRNIEKEQLSNNFNNKDLYLSSLFVKDVYKLDEEMYQELNMESNTLLVAEQVRNILKVTDMDYLDDDVNITVIARKCFLRSALLFIDNSTIIELNSNFNDLLKDDIYKIFYDKERISKDIVTNVFNNIKKDKEKPKTLSLIK